MAETIAAFFKNLPKLNAAKTKEAGRPIYDDRIVVEMRIPGNTGQVNVQPADGGKWIKDGTGRNIFQTFKERFAKQWEQFQANEQQTMEGTPLKELPFLTEAKRMSFRAVGVLTAEQLASLDGTQLKALGMDGREYKNKAQAYLDAAQGVNRTSELEDRIAELEKLLAASQTAAAKFDHDGDGKPGGAKAAEPEAKTGSPFEEYSAEDIKLWLADAAPELNIDGRWGKPKLVELADEVNAKLAASKKVA